MWSAVWEPPKNTCSLPCISLFIPYLFISVWTLSCLSPALPYRSPHCNLSRALGASSLGPWALLCPRHAPTLLCSEHWLLSGSARGSQLEFCSPRIAWSLAFFPPLGNRVPCSLRGRKQKGKLVACQVLRARRRAGHSVLLPGVPSLNEPCLVWS